MVSAIIKVVARTSKGKMRVKRVRRNWFAILGLFVAVFLFTFLVQSFKNSSEVKAANMAGFDPGYIMSDYQMGNYNSMSEAQIQAFLTSKNSCGNRDWNYYRSLSSGSKYTWHWADGHFVCLSEERFGDGEIIGSGDTAAHIIWQAAQDYHINPQVLIVLLQKETGLITDPIPNNGDYRKATGYGCPDTAPCSSEYYGFKNQVRKAAALFRTVLSGGWTNYPLGNNYVRYNPNAGCGGTTVNIRSLATSALYRYTPYQPNGVALTSSYGYGDSCSAYGNRNFYSYFEDWFGGITSNGNFNKVNYEDVKQVDLKNGVYNIMAATNGPKAMSVTGSGDGGNVQTANLDNSVKQQWQIEKVDNYYLIRNKSTGKVLDVANGIFSNIINVWQFAENRSCAQRWIFGEETGGAVVIHNACDPSYVLDLQDGRNNIQIYNKSRSRNNNQSWIIKGISDEDYTGVYNIVASGDNNKSLSISGMLNGNNVATTILDKSKVAQQWQVKKIDNYYLIKNINSGKVLDVANGKMSNLANIWQYDENKSCAQRWIFGQGMSGVVAIHNACNPGLVLDLQEGKSNLQIYAKTASDNYNQNWKLERVDEKNYTGVYNIIASGDKNKSLASTGMLNGNNVATASSDDTDAAQQWQIEKVDNYYLIRNKSTGKILDIANGSMANLTNVWQYSENKSCAQRWLFWENTDGAVTIHNACNTNYVLDLQEGKTNLQIYKNINNATNQKWVLKKAAVVKDYTGVYTIASAADNSKTLRVASKENGGNAQVLAMRSVDRWQVEKVDDYYLIRNIGTGKVLDVVNGSMTNLANVWQYDENRSCAQRWVFWKNTNGTVTIYNACNRNYVLDLQDGKTNLQIYSKTPYNNANQNWLLR